MAIELNLGLLADNAHIDDRGKLWILGEFRYIFTPTVPATYGKFALVARWIATVVELRGKESTFQIEFVDQDGNPVVPISPKFPLQFGPLGDAAPGKMQAQLVLEMGGVPLPKYGEYAFHLIVNGNHTGHVPLYVAVAPTAPPSGPADVTG